MADEPMADVGGLFTPGHELPGMGDVPGDTPAAPDVFSDLMGLAERVFGEGFMDPPPPADAGPPTFAGAVAALATATSSVVVVWGGATDDTWPMSGIVFRVYRAETSAAQNFGVPTQTLAPGVMFWEDTDVTPGVTYFYVVRAHDFSANEDGNTVEVSATPIVTSNLVKPAVSNQSPPSGTPLALTASVSFNVTDDSGLRRVMLTVRQSGVGIEEVAYNGNVFVGFYAGVSTLQSIAGGYRFTLRRRGGWQGGPTFTVYAFDTSGNEATA